MKLFTALVMVASLALGSIAVAAETAATKPAASCCGEKCKDMKDCCKAGADGKMTCTMGGSCCEKK